MNASDRIKKSHVAIMRHKKFCTFSGLLACGKVEITKDIPTACTDGWNRKYNPDFVDSLDDAQLNLLVLHECTHVAYAHLRMWKDLWKENAQLANHAADHFVNLALMDTDAGEGFVKMPTVGAQPDPQYRGKSVRQIFDMLKKDQPPEGEGGGGGEGLDEHDWDKASEQSAEEAAKQGDEVQRALRQGESVRRKLAGKGASGADGMFGDLLTPKIDWRKVLRDFVTETCAGRDESTWRKPNRRYLAEDIYMPSIVGTTMTELVIGFDTSGSVFGGVEMARFVSEISSIVADLNPSKCHVIYWDTDVAGHQVFEAGQFAVQNLKPQGGGGTDGAVLFDYLRDKRINPQAIVQFTDGYVGDWGRSEWPTLWAITTDIKAPFGTSIQIEV
jgi:predicted metal-dependent peptidase